MQGRGSNEIVEKVVLRLLDNAQQSFMHTPFTVDHHHLEILHYALKRRLQTLVDTILSIADPKEVFRMMYDRDEEDPVYMDIDECLLAGEFKILGSILKHCPVKLLDEQLKEGWFMKEQTLQNLEPEYLSKLYVLLKDNKRFKSSELFKRVKHIWTEKQPKAMEISMVGLFGNKSDTSVTKALPQEIKTYKPFK